MRFVKAVASMVPIFLGVIVLYMVAWPVPVDPVAWKPPEAPALEGPYAVNTYPPHQVPTEEQVGAVTEWMVETGMIDTPVEYVDLVVVTP